MNIDSELNQKITLFSATLLAVGYKILKTKTRLSKALILTEVLLAVLVDKLITLGVAKKFADLLTTLPTEERLRWEASPTISADYPFIVQKRADICAALSITPQQLDSIFV